MDMSDRPTPEADAEKFYYYGGTGFVEIDFCRKLERERDELIYIAERAIALAEIDFENDKFGVVSELRSDLEDIKKQNNHSDKMSAFVSEC